MKAKKIKELTEKYKAGNSTLEEDQSLFNSTENTGSIFEPWSAFVKGNKREAPGNFNESLWNSFQNRTRSKYRLRIAMMSAAASVILIITFLTVKPEQEKLSYSEKEALLEQAINMFEDSGQEIVEQDITEQEIIYEDELIIIYTDI